MANPKGKTASDSAEKPAEGETINMTTTGAGAPASVPASDRPFGETQAEIIKVTVPPLPSDGIEPTELYWLGVASPKPIQNITVAGVTFPYFTGSVNFDDRGRPDRQLPLGAEVRLSESKVQHILRTVKDMVMRTSGAHPGIHWRGSRGYIPNPSDRPVAEFIYMVKGRRGYDVPPTLFDGYKAEETKGVRAEVAEVGRRREAVGLKG